MTGYRCAACPAEFVLITSPGRGKVTFCPSCGDKKCVEIDAIEEMGGKAVKSLVGAVGRWWANRGERKS